jgi:Zn-dependent protease/CBS domain-containing protein
MFGIPIMIGASWVVVFALVVFNVMAALGALYPALGAWSRFGLAVCAALLFWGAVLLHELAHAVVAIKQGLTVRNITLFLFGGVANMDREPPSPRAEFLIAIVGPLASVVLGVLLMTVSWVLAGLSRLGARTVFDPFTTIALWLGVVNIVLALFNMLPGFPLDGGRVLRAALWAMLGDVRKATRWASLVGQTLAWLFILGGVLVVFGAPTPFLRVGPLSGLWLIFGGWFLHHAAVQSYRQLVMRALLHDIPVARIMRQDVPTAAPNQSISQLMHNKITGEHHAFPVLREDQLVGIVSRHDVRRVPRPAWDTTTVQAIMTPAAQLVVAQADESMAGAVERLVRRGVNQLPVLRGDQFVGLLRHRDVARWLATQR